jgi:hypothetical protein
MSKDLAAVALGKKRWKGKTDEEKTAHAMKMVAARKKKLKADKN